MIWIAPSEKDADSAALEKRLWDAADQFRANSGLKSQEYSAPVLGLIFLRSDFVFANLPFNVNAVDKERLRNMAGPGRRFPFGLRRTEQTGSVKAQEEPSDYDSVAKQ